MLLHRIHPKVIHFSSKMYMRAYLRWWWMRDKRVRALTRCHWVRVMHSQCNVCGSVLCNFWRPQLILYIYACVCGHGWPENRWIWVVGLYLCVMREKWMHFWVVVLWTDCDTYIYWHGLDLLTAVVFADCFRVVSKYGFGFHALELEYSKSIVFNSG